MAYIYKIVNDLNQKVYIGKTDRTIEIRWYEHKRDYKNKARENRPLYKAFNKYGIENFHIELIEETTDPEEREKYWIEQYGSFKYGYNATLGGDGKPFVDVDLILSLWNNGETIYSICQITGYTKKTISFYLENSGISKEIRLKRGIEALYRPVLQLDKETNEVINIFPSIKAACDFLGKQHSGHISSVCRGQRKTAYGYKWKYGDI